MPAKETFKRFVCFILIKTLLSGSLAPAFADQRFEAINAAVPVNVNVAPPGQIGTAHVEINSQVIDSPLAPAMDPSSIAQPAPAQTQTDPQSTDEESKISAITAVKSTARAIASQPGNVSHISDRMSARFDNGGSRPASAAVEAIAGNAAPAASAESGLQRTAPISLFGGEFDVKDDAAYTYAHYYEHPQTGRKVVLLGMNHVGEKEYFDQADKILSGADTVIFEGSGNGKNYDAARDAEDEKLLSGADLNEAYLAGMRLYFTRAETALHLPSEWESFNYHRDNWVSADNEFYQKVASDPALQAAFAKAQEEVNKVPEARKKQIVDYVKQRLDQIKAGNLSRRDVMGGLDFFWSDKEMVSYFLKALGDPRDQNTIEIFDRIVSQKNPNIVAIKYGAAHTANLRRLLEERGYVEKQKVPLKNMSLASAAPAIERPGMPTRIVLGKDSFSVSKGGGTDKLSGLIKSGEFQNEKDPVKRREMMISYLQIDAAHISFVFDSPLNPAYVEDDKAPGAKERRAEFRKKEEEFAAKVPEIIKSQFESTLAQFEHSVEHRGDLTIYTVPRGLEFWSRLVTDPSPEKKMAAIAFLNSRMLDEETTSKTVRSFLDDLYSPAFLLDAGRLSPGEKSAVERLSSLYSLQKAQTDRYMTVGQGMNFNLVQQIFRLAESLTDPLLIRRFARVVRFLALAGITIISHEHQGAAAYYSPLDDQMAYVMPSRADLDTTTHEINHARFSRFEKRLSGWLAAKKYAMPYEADGPGGGLFASFGGFMNLLNELNSWRIGESFGDKANDAKILEILRRGYGSQAGWENVRLFSRIWTPAAVKGKSVPRLILDSVRNLNRIKNEDLPSFGAAALKEKDVVKANNFLRLTVVRYPNFKEAPAAVQDIVRQMTKYSDQRIAEIAARISGKRSIQIAVKDEKEDVLEPILSKKTSRAQKLKRLKKLLGWALAEDTDATTGRQEEAVGAIEKLFKAWNFEEIYEPETLAEFNRLDSNLSDKNQAEEHKNRPLMKDHLFFSQEIDSLLAKGMFNKAQNAHRLALVNLITARAYPEELPQLHHRLLQVIASKKPNKNDFWLARMFLVPKGEFFPAHIAWGEDAVAALQKDRAPSATALEFAAEFYRTGVAGALTSDSLWGRLPSVRLNAARRTAVQAEIDKFTPLQKDRFERSLPHLWLMLNHADARVRTAARYAIATYPGYAIGLEDRLLTGLQQPPSGLRKELIQLISMTEKGFLPKLDRRLENAFQPTAAEMGLLALRPAQTPDARPIAERAAYHEQQQNARDLRTIADNPGLEFGE